jgi:hypothetical protein
VLDSYTSFHFLNYLDLVIPIMENRWVRQGGQGLTEPEKYAYLIGVGVYPIWVIYLRAISNDQHSEKVLQWASWNTFYI